ncbi:MAG: HTH domain-containing protein [Candidatus Nitrosocaldus sp.]
MPKRYSIEEVKQRIVDVLRQSDSGLSGIEIAERTGINRVTITKYLNILETMGIIKRKSMGPVNVWYIQHGVDLSSKDILELQQVYMDALFTYDEDKVRTILLNAIHSNIDPILLISDVVIPTVNTAGELYARGRMGAMDIMLVNNLAMESLDLIKFNASRVDVKRNAYAVFISMNGKSRRGTVDMKAASIAFYIKGWNPFLLGNIASEAGLFLDIDIVRFINRIWKDKGKGIILLYITVADEEVATLNELIRSVKEKLEKSILVIVGGRVLDRLESKDKEMGEDTGAGAGGVKDTVYPYIDYYTMDIMKAVEWAEKMYRSLKF